MIKGLPLPVLPRRQVMDQSGGDGRFRGRTKIIALNSRVFSFPEFEQNHPEIPIQEEGQSRETEIPERGPVSTRKTDRIHDLRLLSSDWRSWHSSWLRRLILCYSSRRHCSGIRHKMGRTFIINDEDSIRWSSGKSAQTENTWVWSTQKRIGLERHGDSSDTSVSKYQKLKSIDQNLRLRNFDARHGENWNRSSGQESKGIKWRWRRKRYLLSVERKKANVRRESSADSGMRVTIVPNQSRIRMPPHLSSHQWHEVEVCRGKEVSMMPFFDNRADTIWKVLACDRLVNIAILPNVISRGQVFVPAS